MRSLFVAWLFVYGMVLWQSLMSLHGTGEVPQGRPTSSMLGQWLPSLSLPPLPNETTSGQSQSSTITTSTPQSPQSPRVLMGIFCLSKDIEYRVEFRKLFGLHPNVCSVGLFQGWSRKDKNKNTSRDRSICRLIYSFVIGASPDPHAPTKIIDSSRPCVVPQQQSIPQPQNILPNEPQDDLVFLNIRENMNEGKSTTWFYCATSTFMEGIEYVGKMDTDTLPLLDQFMKQIQQLPPMPYHKNTLIGYFLNKHTTWRSGTDQRKEKYFDENYESNHPYAQGALYIFSEDVAASLPQQHNAFQLEGIEDHDQSTMAMLNKKNVPMRLHMVSRDLIWWKHPLKRDRRNKKRWEQEWKAEQDRIGSMFSATTSSLAFVNSPHQNSDSVPSVIPPMNIHSKFHPTCSGETEANYPHHTDIDFQRVLTAFYDMVFGYDPRARVHQMGHFSHQGPAKVGLKQLERVQHCQYYVLEQFWKLAKKYNITRWSAHGGTALAAVCHRSINPWDDDIDITVSSCGALNQIWDMSNPNISRVYPDLDPIQYGSNQPFDARLLDSDWILMKGNWGDRVNWFKLKSIVQSQIGMTGKELSGMDIQCIDAGVSKWEKGPQKQSGYWEYLLGKEPLQVIDFGPSKIQLVPNKIVDRYSQAHNMYRSLDYCDFPYSKVKEPVPTISLPAYASQLYTTMSKWYFSLEQRESWRNQVGKIDGKALTKEVPNLDFVEIDNLIAPVSSCSNLQRLKVIAFNAERGTQWSNFVKLVTTDPKLADPDVILLNEMDVGMARSGNIHTTRKLAASLQMNYAWGLEFVELTNGNAKEQNRTLGQQNTMGLHGNAILSKCPLSNAMILRDPLEPVFFSIEQVYGNAYGREKRLGGRMGMFAKMGNTTDNWVVGSVHKLKMADHKQQFDEYIAEQKFSNLRGILLGGDFPRVLCKSASLKSLDLPQKHLTWPASCETRYTGRTRGDNFCGSLDLKIVEPEKTVFPCVQKGEEGVIQQLSDHMITVISVKSLDAH